MKGIVASSVFRYFDEKRKSDFVSHFFNPSVFFPHRTYYLPKCGPDAFQIACRMCGISDPSKMWEIILYAEGSILDEFSEDIFFHNNIIWHQQQFGRKGQIATANLVLKGDSLCVTIYVSDLVQRISRKKEYKTRIEKKFKGWAHMLMNSVMNFAVERNIRKVYSPTADLVMTCTDPSRTIERELYDRVYDRTVSQHFRTVRKGKWWVIDVTKNRDKTVIPERKEEIIDMGKTICICHDIEKGLGHLDTDSDFVKVTDEVSSISIDEMMAIEKENGIKVTYNVLGCLFDEFREKIEKEGHSLSFHSYDHKITKMGLPYILHLYSARYRGIIKSISKKSNRFYAFYAPQLSKCRKIDYRVKGYRAPQSKIAPELSDANLCYHNFEWLASSPGSLKITFPKMENGIVKIPILFDDYEMFRNKVNYEVWEQKALDMIKENYFVAFCLHDCYAQYWLPHYKDFLKKIIGLGTFKTMDEIASEVILGNAK